MRSTRLLVLVVIVGGTILLLVTLAVRNLRGLIAMMVIYVLMGLFVVVRARRMLAGPNLVLRKTPLIARIPVFAAMAAFIAYALVLAFVHIHLVNTLVSRSERAVTAYGAQQKRLDATTGAEDRLAAGIRHQITRDRHHQRPNDGFPNGRHFVSQFEAVTRAHKRAEHSPAETTMILTTLVRVAVPTVPTRNQPEYAPELTKPGRLERQQISQAKALTRLHNGYPVSLNALPRWFGGLGNFFVLAAQLLAGLIVALALWQGRLRQHLADQYVRLAMLFAVLGLAASVVGRLPTPHRGPQAFLLGYVFAGFTGTLTVLLLLTSDLISPRTARP